MSGIVVFGAQGATKEKGQVCRLSGFQGRYGDSLPGGQQCGHTVKLPTV